LIAVVVVAVMGVVAFLSKQGLVPAGTAVGAASAPGSAAVQQATAPPAPAATAASADTAPATGISAPASGVPGATDSATPPVHSDVTAQAAPATPPVPEVTGTGSIRLAVKPWAMVRVDGIEKAVTPPLKLLTLPVGKHVVELVNSGFPPHVLEVEVEKDKRITLSYEFK
jgi:non-specific serine/threonine protein kinase